MTCLAIFTFFAVCVVLTYCTPVKRQAEWNTNNLGNGGSIAFPSNFPGSAFGPSWEPGRPQDSRQQPFQRPNRPNGRPTSTRRPVQTSAPTTGSTTTPSPSVLHSPPEGCPCFKTSQFNPVCGSDSNTYVNMALLKCYQNCGTDVSMRYMGSCRRSSG